MTDGRFVIGDAYNNISYFSTIKNCFPLGQVLSIKTMEDFTTRFLLTAREFDDTAKYSNLFINTEISYKIYLKLLECDINKFMKNF